MNKLIGYAFLAAMLPTGPVGNEINGFRLGMSIEAAKQRAIEKGYILGRGTKSTSNWISFVLANQGQTISFCGDTLRAVAKSYAGELHELVRLVRDWTWTGSDNVSRQIGFVQLVSDQPSISYSYSYIKHPCRD